MTRIVNVAIEHETDVVSARQRARRIAELLGLDIQDQTRVATAVSEIVRNAFDYAGGGRCEFHLIGTTAPQLLEIVVSDRGRGMDDVAAVLRGEHRSVHGMGLGISGTQRLMDQFSIQSGPGKGTTVVMRKLLPGRGAPVGSDRLRQIADQLAQDNPGGALEELRSQNRELLVSLETVRSHREELAKLNDELQDTNRGVVALYAELGEKAEHLRDAHDLKSKFLSNMSHEFRTPLNSITALTRLLLDLTDGELTPEQSKQVGFIRKSAASLTELVDDLLDLAKAEAGKIVVHPVEFIVEDLFGALRGMLRPLLAGDHVALVFDDAGSMPCLYTDEGKVSQILRNFISNALKFTEHGEVRVSAGLSDDGSAAIFAVKDTGIGIAAEDHAAIFDEFAQIESPIQRKVRGTGLGLSLSKRLAELLRGEIHLDSALGVGSTFFFRVPVHYEDPGANRSPATATPHDPSRIPILAVEDDAADILVYETVFRDSPYQLYSTRGIAASRRAIADIRPRAILLDVLLGAEQAWRFLADLKQAPETKRIPVIVATTEDERRKAESLGADAFARKPIDTAWLLRKLGELVARRPTKLVLVIDDDEVSRYLVRQALAGMDIVIVEASSGASALQRIADDPPDAIFLDLSMPGLTGFDVLEHLSFESTTRHIPTMIVTSAVLTAADSLRLGHAAAVVSKARLDRQAVVAFLENVGAATEEDRQ